MSVSNTSAAKSTGHVRANSALSHSKKPLIEARRDVKVQDLHSESDSDTDSDTQGPGPKHPVSSSVQRQASSGSSSRHKKSKSIGAGWDILTGLQNHLPSKAADVPKKREGYLLKRRKWPLKGWHKRYFMLDKGLFYYSKSQNQMVALGRYHGQIDLGNSFISYKRRRRRIHVDAGEIVHHIKVKKSSEFDDWLESLSLHRLYRHQILKSQGALVNSPAFSLQNEALDSTDAPLSAAYKSLTLTRTGSLSKQGPSVANRSPSFRTQVSMRSAISVLEDRGVSDSQVDKLKSLQATLFDLQSLLDVTASENQKSDRTKSANDSLSTSNPNLSGELAAAVPTRLQSRHSALDMMMTHNTAAVTHIVRQDSTEERLSMFIAKAYSAMECLRTLGKELANEKLRSTDSSELSQLQSQIAEIGRQNQELRLKLNRCHAESDLSSLYMAPLQVALPKLSSSLSHESVSEFHDAEERLSLAGSSSDSGEEISDNEDEETKALEISSELVVTTGRREFLPAPAADTAGLSLMNILCRNIGKDLTSIRMPVLFNEPLSVLQRLCEEIEYSSLLDQAAVAKDPLQRLVLVTAFAVSGYAYTASRSARKPFNPLLTETFECVREDKGWKFLAEQVSHHPPISAAHCTGTGWELSQDVRLKNRFWGKSLEATPVGNLTLKLSDSGETYVWNKVTTCVFNLFTTNRYIDHYGDVTIQSSQGPTAKLTFHKGGAVSGICKAANQETAVFGRWAETFLCGKDSTARCVWRSGALPPQSAQFYGFTRFAIELNELEHDSKTVLPPTDSRLRPDQRYLEEGQLELAENEKKRIEDLQRLNMKEKSHRLKPRWFTQSASSGWMFSTDYWQQRQKRFVGEKFVELW